LAEALAEPSLRGVLREVRTKGIYVNLRLEDRWLMSSAQFIADVGDEFGTSDVEAARTVIVDYSAPNVAKTLHAGHIRSTIVGHVLANLYEACGALVYRINHINDFGGFGFILEGWRRFEHAFPAELTKNHRLLELYAIRRTLERHARAGTELAALPDADRALLDRYFPVVRSPANLADAYAEFVSASDRRFERLEAGDPDEVALWATMVEWSLDDFREFYDLLDIHIPFTIGESFFVGAGATLVRDAVDSGKAVRFTPELARARIDAAPGDEHTDAQIEKDIGAIVIPLPSGNRLVVQRADGRSIYATRDLGAVALRMELFAPTDIVYVVGQEQRVHFERLFEAARVLGLVTDEVALRHVYFGFYVDAKSGRKLSSRDSVASVNNLLGASIAHFRAKSAEAGDQTDEELDRAGRALAVGSLVMNDLKQDMKSSVNVTVGDLAATITGFERAGGAYVVYAACRARAILRTWGKPVPPVSEIPDAELTSQEIGLLLKLHEIPVRVRKAVQAHDPSVLLRHLVDLATRQLMSGSQADPMIAVPAIETPRSPKIAASPERRSTWPARHEARYVQARVFAVAQSPLR
jgi:arginyl-tRNA synthetase